MAGLFGIQRKWDTNFMILFVTRFYVIENLMGFFLNFMTQM